MVINGHKVGSAFMIQDEIAVTNAHVLRGRKPGDIVTLIASGPGFARAEGRVVAISSRIDLALLGVPASLMPMIPPFDARAVAGLRVSSAGVDASGHAQPRPSEASGYVTEPDIDLPDFGPGLVANMPNARLGYSGGPLLDEQGRLVGMVSAIRTSGKMTTAAGGSGESYEQVEAFALRANVIRAEVSRLLAQR